MTQSYVKELGEYIKGKRREFTFPIDWSSLRPFQLKTLKIVFAIPYGETRTYADVAVQIKPPTPTRRWAGECHESMPIVIPCHRVIGKDGKLQRLRRCRWPADKECYLD